MRVFIFFVIFGVAGFTAGAQVVGLHKNEVEALKGLLKADADARSVYSRFENVAAKALMDTPNPADTIFSEGRLASDPKKIITGRSLRDIEKIYALALVYRVNGDRKYLDKAAAFFTAWGSRNQPNGNPINDTKFADVVTAFDLVKADLDMTDRKITEAWLSKMAAAEIGNPRFNADKGVAVNNWNSHRLMIIGMIGYALNNLEFQQYVIGELPEHLEKNLYPDGSGYDFHERDALHYHVYTLEPLLELVTILKRAGETNYYLYKIPGGASIQGSVKFLEPFVTGEKTHEEFVNSKVGFDKARANNNEPNFKAGALFKPDHGARVFSLAAWFEPSLLTVAKKGFSSEQRYPDWQSVLNVVKK